MIFKPVVKNIILKFKFFLAHTLTDVVFTCERVIEREWVDRFELI